LLSGVKAIEIPEKCEIVDGAFIGVKSVSIRSSNPFFVGEGDFVFTKSKKMLIHYSGCASRIVVPKSVEIIGMYLFYGCQSLNEVLFESGSNLQRIETMAFVHSGLKTIRIPWTVGFIGESCFYECESLNEIRFKSGCKLERIEKDTF
jgi:hypothetical protein